MAARRRASRKRRTTRRRTTRRRRVTRRRRTTRRRRVVRRRRKKRVSIRGSRIQVFRGTKAKTKSGHNKSMLMKNKRGKIVTKKSHSAGMKQYKKNGLNKWTAACMKARKKLNIKGFKAIKKG